MAGEFIAPDGDLCSIGISFIGRGDSMTDGILSILLFVSGTLFESIFRGSEFTTEMHIKKFPELFVPFWMELKYLL